MSWRPFFLPRGQKSDRSGPNRASPPRLLIESFLVLIAIGTLLLKLPVATVKPISWLDAAFTATSAMTVTGLTVVDTGTEFTLFGQLVIMVLIQLGGLGLMTFAVLSAVALGFKLGLSQQLLAREAFNEISFKTTVSAGVAIALFAFTAEAIGAVILAFSFVPELGWWPGLFHALFYSVSAFNNAGFALSPLSLIPYDNNWAVCLPISLLFISGGLGYVVVREIVEKRGFRNLSVYARLILYSTVAINVVASLLFFAFEKGNPAIFTPDASASEVALISWFQAVTPRTAGFNSVEIGALTNATSVLFLLLMFVGGAPNSTASGIKLSTFVVLLAATRAFLRGQTDVNLLKRSISRESVFKALAITVTAMATIFLAILLLSITEKGRFLDIAFETVSAFGTVGLSRGLTGELSEPGKLIIMTVMLIGRVGPLTLAFLLTVPRRQAARYAKTEFPVG